MTETTDNTARVERDTNGRALGCMVFLTADDLAELGLDIQYEQRLRYRVENGRLRISIGEGGPDER